MKQCVLEDGRESAAQSQGREVRKEERRTDGMTESRSLTVRSGMMTSFCATTVVTPFFVTVFMRGKKEGKREREKETVYGMLKDRGALMMSERETKKKVG